LSGADAEGVGMSQNPGRHRRSRAGTPDFAADRRATRAGPVHPGYATALLKSKCSPDEAAPKPKASACREIRGRHRTSRGTPDFAADRRAKRAGPLHPGYATALLKNKCSPDGAAPTPKASACREIRGRHRTSRGTPDFAADRRATRAGPLHPGYATALLKSKCSPD